MERRCVECGAVIPRGRLQALPDAVLCVDCVEVRPYTEDDLEPSGADGAEAENDDGGSYRRR